MSTTVIDDPTVIASSEPQRVSAISPYVKLILSFGVLWGIIVGIIGQFVFRGMLEAELLRSQTLSIEFSWQIIGLELSSLAIALILAFIVLAFVWKASSRQTAILTSLSIGFVFALTVHAVVVGAVNGAIYNRDVWIFLHQNFAADDKPYLAILATGIVRSVQESMVFGLLLLLLLSGFGAIAGFFLPVDSNQSKPATKYAFGSVAALVFPATLLQLAFVSLILIPTLIESINTVATDTGQSIPTHMLLPAAFLPPLLGGIVALLVAIIWAWKVDLVTVHHKILRLSQILMAILGGVLILSTSTSYIPGLWDDLPSRFAMISIMALAWLYAVVLQLRLNGYKGKAEDKARASNLSLAFVGIAVLIISFLLMDMFGTRLFLNIILYPIVFMPEGIQDTINPNQRVTEILYAAITSYWLELPQVIGLYALIGMAIYQPIVWLANKFER